MKKIGNLRIGQTPRPDLTEGLLDILGPGYEIIEAGGLDDLTLEQVNESDLNPEDYILVTKMREGTDVKITKKFIIPRMQEKLVERLAREGTIVVATGGGGVPVYRDAEGRIRPSEAVIDKDLASALLGARIGADEFYILTDVPFVYINYGSPQQEIKEFLNYKDTHSYLEQGMFGEGDMAPKVRAALQFIKKGGEKSVITEAFKLEDRSYGTKITMEYDA